MKIKYKTILFVIGFAIFLLLFTQTQAKAASSNNPIFATIQFVQDAINAAISPLQNSLQGLSNRVTNLEVTVTPIPGQITTLQN